jgi:membrane protease YdiL (CAAX protease family)
MQPDRMDDESDGRMIPEPAPPLPQTTVEREPFWGYLDLLFVLVLMVVGFLVIDVIALSLAHGDMKPLMDSPQIVWPTNLAAYAVVYLALRLVLGARYGAPVFASLGWRPSRFNLGVAALGGVLLAFGLSALAYLIHTPKVSTFDKLASTPFSLAALAITAVAIAPLFEELLFRGFLQPLLTRTIGVTAAVLVTSFLFGALHAFQYMKLWQYVAAVSLVGVALGILRAYTNSIIPGVVMHGCFNAVSVVALVVSKYNPSSFFSQ